MRTVAAVDLGATSGRVILGHVEAGTVHLEHVARFPNVPVALPEGVDGDGHPRTGLHWDIVGLHRSLTAGLREAFRSGADVASIGIDSWAVDYALLRGGRMVRHPYSYRDARTTAGVAGIRARMTDDELYRRNGLQHLPFNTLYQFEADRLAGDLELADRALLVPDLLGYWLTGVDAAERTNASTTGLLDPLTREWDAELVERLALPPGLLAPLAEAGSALGGLLSSAAEDLGAPTSVGVTLVGSHDTASAVAAVPATSDDFAYISSGTWSLVGVELEAPSITDAGRAGNFTNEGGVDGRIRYLKNVSGLWLLSESVRTWERGGETIDLSALLAEAAAVTHPVAVFDAADERFVAPGDMPARISAWCAEHAVAAPRSRAETVRSILESLAAAYGDTIEQLARLTGRRIDVIHVVGGGSQNTLLCQLTADRTGRPVLAGPVEATALGNVLVQARAAGLVSGDLEALRALVATTVPPVSYLPRTSRKTSPRTASVR